MNTATTRQVATDVENIVSSLRKRDDKNLNSSHGTFDNCTLSNLLFPSRYVLVNYGLDSKKVKSRFYSK